MARFAMLLACCSLLLTGCADMLGFNPAQAQQNAQPANQAKPPEPKTPIIRALIQAVDEVEGENQQVKDGLKQSLREADKELSQVLGGNSKRLILQANKKPLPPTICEKAKPIVGHVKWEQKARKDAGPKEDATESAEDESKEEAADQDEAAAEPADTPASEAAPPAEQQPTDEAAADPQPVTVPESPEAVETEAGEEQP